MRLTGAFQTYGTGCVLLAGLFLGICLVLPSSISADPVTVGALQSQGTIEVAAITGPSSAPLQPGSNAVTGIRLGDQGTQTRFVMELSGPNAANYQVFTLADPYRVVIDLSGVTFHLDTDTTQPGRGVVSRYRFGHFQGNTSRVVIDTNGPVSIARNFVLEPQGGFARRIVLDLAPSDRASFVNRAGWPESDKAASESQRVIDPVAVSVPTNPTTKETSRKVIVIDAGHGGVDPGTHGQTGVNEKEVVLAFAKEFAKKLKDTGRYDVHLTRSKDVFIPLRERISIARRHKADLFVSIHADSIAKSNVRGMSIYTLSETASDKEAEALARKENLSDAIAGIDLKGESSEVTGILIDLAQRETKNYSARFARSVVDHAGQTTKLLDPAHRFAGFVVLKAPDVPSVLIELGFLTNRDDEKQLTSSTWRAKTAAAFVRAVDRYFGDRLAEGGN
jgi:N-acetylmuramoyl-L-alanine amidase